MEAKREAAIRYLGANYDKDQLDRLLSGEVTPHPVHEEPIIRAYIAGAESRDEEVDKLEEQHDDDRQWLECAEADIKFYRAFIEYLADRAIGDKSQIIEAVANNMRNAFIGYVKVTKSLNSQQDLILEFQIEGNEFKYKAEWQPSDNYACWQQCHFEDDYDGYLLFPTYEDDEYFCMWYSC